VQVLSFMDVPMIEPTQKADTTDARQASMSRVVTQETLLASMATVEATSEPATEKVDAEQQEGGDKPKGKKSAQERITELAAKRNEAEAKADAEKRRADELEERIKALESSKAAPVEQGDKPNRQQYDTEDEYIEALADWKASEAIAKREQQQREAKLKAESDSIDSAFTARLEKAVTEIEDYKEVVSSATVEIPDFMVMAIKESDQGPMLVYYLAQHPDEAKKIAAMRPIQALKQLLQIEKGLSEDDEPAPKASPERKRAPEPITPVKGSTTPNPGKPKSFDDYRARRKAEQGR
jgi:hypothetical protein